MRFMCIDKVRNEKGVIVKYVLKNENGDRIKFTDNEIKDGIILGTIEVVNLRMDKTGRLVDKAVKAEMKDAFKAEMKAEMKGVVKEVKAYINKLNIKCVYEEDLMEDYGASYFDADDECRLTPVIKKFFDELVDKIRNAAMKDEVTVRRYGYTEEKITVSLPDSVDKIIKLYGISSCVVLELVFLASTSGDLAFIRCGTDRAGAGFNGKMILTSSYDKAKEFIIDCVNDEAYRSKILPTELMLQSDYVYGYTMLGKVFVLKMHANIQKHDINYYKEGVLTEAKNFKCEEREEAIRSALELKYGHGVYFLALTLGILSPRYKEDVLDTPDWESIEESIIIEADRLAVFYDQDKYYLSEYIIQ